MPEFRLPTTPEEWDTIEPNETDGVLINHWITKVYQGESWGAVGLAAVARLLELERERCIAARARSVARENGNDVVTEGDRLEAIRILEER